MTIRYTVSPGGPALVFSAAVLATFDRYRQLSLQEKEAGGQLFAQFDGADTIILEASPPKWLDRRSRNGFVPNRWIQQREIRERYARRLHFVGDWHTHPEPIPRPSREDIDGMIDCFGRSLHDLHAFVMVIAGTMPAPEGLYVAVVDRRSAKQMRLDQANQCRIMATSGAS
ncbi:MAG: Mov34/MPN/PAD-1 family protein [Nitrospira sp.]|nr:Mov34/MPN/PAD-1 family protein [Nitrospira sp.]